MFPLEIKKYPDPILKKKSQKIEKVDSKIKKLVSDMLSTMYRSRDGVGLAAPQVGVLKRLVVCDWGEGPLVFINPEILDKKDKCIMNEGCLSFPGLHLDIKRAKEIKMEFLNLEGKKIKVEMKDLPARVLQHEVDHLGGILLIDRLGFLQKRKIFTLLNKNLHPIK